MDLPFDCLGREWAARRGRRALMHVDAAAAGRTSTRVQARIAQHLAAESDHGGYVAEAAAADEIAALQAGLGSLLGTKAEDIAFVESSSNALAQLIDAWPLHKGDTIWAVRTEWGPNLAAFADRGLTVQWLKTDPGDRVDLDALTTRLRTARPAAIHLTAAASHRALVQPDHGDRDRMRPRRGSGVRRRSPGARPDRGPSGSGSDLRNWTQMAVRPARRRLPRGPRTMGVEAAPGRTRTHRPELARRKPSADHSTR